MSDAVDLGALLTIDVGSELRKLSSAQLQGPWQIPAEIARRAIRGGATTVHIRTRRGAVEVEDDGAPISTTVLRATAALLQSEATNEVRHEALTSLEHAGGLALLAVCGLAKKTLHIEVESAEATLVLRANHRRSTLERRPASGRARRRNVVRVESPALDRRQVQTWLRSVARFDGDRIHLDGHPVPSAWKDTFIHGRLNPPTPGRIGLPHQGETAHVWLLEHGIITGHLTVPDAPIFEAAIEMGSEATDLSAARLREATMPHIAHIVAGAVQLACAFGPRTHSLDPTQRARFARLLINAARRRIDLERVVQVPIFRVIDGEQQRLASLLELRRAASDGNTLPALYPSQDPDGFALGERLTLIADATERTGLAEVLGSRFRPPNPRERGRSARAAVKQWSETLGRVASRVLHPFGARPVNPSSVTPEETQFVQAMRAQLNGGRGAATDVQLCEGSGPVRTGGKGRDILLLPRHNEAVRSAMAAVSADPSWAYPAALALLQGEGLPSLRGRNRWRDAWS
ncbi:MAG: hypothetical protein ACE37F_29580 [Nannocystaceae bacterium]|nr:hypothetical protein [bacterium]